MSRCGIASPLFDDDGSGDLRHTRLRSDGRRSTRLAHTFTLSVALRGKRVTEKHFPAPGMKRTPVPPSFLAGVFAGVSKSVKYGGDVRLLPLARSRSAKLSSAILLSLRVNRSENPRRAGTSGGRRRGGGHLAGHAVRSATAASSSAPVRVEERPARTRTRRLVSREAPSCPRPARLLRER